MDCISDVYNGVVDVVVDSVSITVTTSACPCVLFVTDILASVVNPASMDGVGCEVVVVVSLV